MSFYTCDYCNEPKNYGRFKSTAEIEIIQQDLKFCCYNCLKRYFKELENKDDE